MKLFITAFTAAIVIACLTSSFAEAESITVSPEKKIILAGTDNTKNSMHGRWLELIYTEVFRRLGYKLEYIGYPAKRSSYFSDQGFVDGEIHRVYSYAEKHPDMIRVEEPHFSIYFSAYAIQPGIKLNGWESLKDKGYRVVYRLGVTKTESELPLVVRPEKLTAVPHTDQGLKMLLNGRADIYIDVESVIEEVLATDEYFKLYNIHKAGIMEEITVHAFLHKKHKDLVPKVSSVLRQLKDEGLIDQYKQLAILPGPG